MSVFPLLTYVFCKFQYLAFPIELIQRITDKLAKHTRTEEATIKHIRDLEMQIKNTLETFNVSAN